MSIISVVRIRPVPKIDAQAFTMTASIIMLVTVVLISVMMATVPIAMLDAMAIVAVPVAMFGTAFVVAAMEVALVTAFEMARSGEVPTPTIITAPCFRLRSQSDHKY